MTPVIHRILKNPKESLKKLKKMSPVIHRIPQDPKKSHSIHQEIKNVTSYPYNAKESIKKSIKILKKIPKNPP